MSERNEYVSPSSKAPAELGDPATVDGRQPLKICLILSEQVVAYLDSIANQKGCQLNRSSVVRAIVSAFSKRGIRFSGAREEGDIRAMVGRPLDYYLANQKSAAPASRPPQASARANRVGAGNGSGKTTVVTTIATALPPPGGHDYELRFDRLSESHPIAVWPQETKEVKTKYLELVTGSPSLADYIEKAHAAWRAHWEDHQDGYIPPLIKWLANGYYLKTPQADTPNDRGSRVEALKASLGYTSGVSK
jgi:hypothetical protein